MMPAAANPEGGGRGVLAMLAAVVALVLGAALPAAAQPSRPSVSASFGWSSTSPAERFAPIFVTIDPGDQPLDGVVSITVPQDAVQDMRMVAAFAAAPGRPAVVEFAASMPILATRVRIEVRNQRGRLVAAQTYSSMASAGELPIPPSLLMYEDVVVAVGAPGLVAASPAWYPSVVPAPSRDTGPRFIVEEEEPKAFDLFAHTVVADVPAGRLPTAWIAYDSVRCLVLRASATSSIEPGAAAAIREWVLDGGKLVLIADEPGQEWITWVAPASRAAGLSSAVSEAGPGSLPIELADAQPGATPAAVVDIVRQTPHQAVDPESVVAPTLFHRPIGLTESGRALGWQLHWPVASEGGPALLAEGPVGLGMVTVVGFDPADAVLGVDRAATARVWKHVLAGALAPYGRDEDRRDDAASSYVVQGSGDSASARAAATAAADHLADFPVPSTSVFFLVIGAGFVLALLVGPVDAIVLKRAHKRQISWMTALAWTAVACVLAWFLPSMVMTSGGRLVRLTVIDQVHDGLGRAALSRQTAFTGVFSSSSGDAGIAVEDPTAWHRGISPLATYSFTRTQQNNTLPFRVAVEDAVVPMALGEEGVPTRVARLRSVPMPVSTFLTLMSRGRGDLPVIARVTGGPGSWGVTIAGMPEGAVVDQAMVRIGDGVYAAVFAADPETGHLVAELEPVAGNAYGQRRRWLPAATPPSPSDFSRQGVERFGRTIRGGEGLALLASGADARGDAVETMVRSGQWAALYLSITGLPVDATSLNASSSKRDAITRLVLPLPEPVASAQADRWTPPDPALPAPLVPGGGDEGDAGTQTPPEDPADPQPEPPSEGAAEAPADSPASPPAGSPADPGSEDPRA